MPSLTDRLHDEIDEAEALSTEARDIVRARMLELPEVLRELAAAEEAGEIETPATPQQSIADAIEVIGKRIVADMNTLTTRAALAGIEAGKRRTVRG